MQFIAGMKRLVMGLLIAVAAALPSAAPAADPDELKIAVIGDYLPFSGINLKGDASGYIADVWKLWSEKTGVPVRFIVGSFAETVEAVRDGRADIHGSLFRNHERDQWLSFSRTLHEVSSSFYYWRGDAEAPTMASLGGRSIGVIAGSHQELYLRQSPLRFRARGFTETIDMLRALARGEIAAILHEDIAMRGALIRNGVTGEVGKLHDSPLRNAVHAGVPTANREMRALVDWGLSQISNAEFAEMERRWLDTQDKRFFVLDGGAAPLNDTEQAWMAANAGRKFKIGIQVDWPPMASRGHKGGITGMTPAIFQLINERMGGILELMPGRWADMLADVRAGTLDGILDISPHRGRMPDINFTAPYLVVPHIIVTRRGVASPRRMDDLGDSTVAIERGYLTAAFLRDTYPTVTVREYDGTLAALNAVAAGDADAWIGNRAVFNHYLETNSDSLADLRDVGLAQGRQSVLGLGTREELSVLRDIIDKAIMGLDPVALHKITEPWLKGTVGGDIALSESERAWLAEHTGDTIRVAVEDWPPFSYMDNGAAKGLAIGYMRYVLEQLGLKMEPVPMRWVDILPAIGNFNGVDLIPAIAPSDEREKIVKLTKPHLTMPRVIFTRTEAPLISGLGDLDGATIAVEEGFITEQMLRRDYPNIKLLRVASTHAALQAVSLSRAEAYIGNLAGGSYQIERHGLTNIKVAAPSGYPEDRQAMGVRRDWPELASLIDKVLRRMGDAEHNRLRSEAMAIRYDLGIDMKEIMTYAIPVGGAVLVIIGVIVFSNRRLASQIKERHAAEAELHEKDAQLTAALENMSGGMFMVDKDLKFRVFNKKFVEMYNLPEIQIGMPLRDVLMIRAIRGEYGPGDIEPQIEARLAGYKDASLHRVEDNLDDGRTIEGFRQPTADGGLVCIFNDITIRKKAEAALAQQTTQLQNLSVKLSRYLSPQIYEAIFAGASDASVTTARKKLTVFFSDIKNFTATTEEMEPEDMTYILNDYLTKMTEIALEFGGTIDKYIGDAIMVFFGDPDTKGVKEDALAAVRMAVAMQRRMVDLRAKWADMGFEHPFEIRCGINTGYCNVGNFGSEQRIDYTIIGGQVNLAARLESICEPNGITIAYETYSHVRDEFAAEAMEPIMVKGIKDPVHPYRLTGVLENYDTSERYIRRDIRGMRLWVDLMRMTEEQRLRSIKELQDALAILEKRGADNAADD